MAELNTQLNRHLNHLVEELTLKIPATLGTDQPRAAYAEALERQQAIQRRIQFLKRIADGLAVVPPEALVRGQVGFGSVVKVEDLQTGEILTYTIMSGDGLDLDAGEISLASPVAQALLGRGEADEVEVATPQRQRGFRILSTTTLFDFLGLQEPPAVECA